MPDNGSLSQSGIDGDCVLQGDIVVLDVNSQQSGGPTVTTADDCCNECRKNTRVSLMPDSCALTQQVWQQTAANSTPEKADLSRAG